MPTTVRSHAKINLGLGIGAPRPDGFHALATVYQTIELHDLVTVTARPAAATELRLTSNDDRVPTDNRNTAWKMVFLALEELGVTATVQIHIEKRLPVQGGLGAGSANAVAALVGLEVELRSAGIRGIAPIEQTTLEGWGTQLALEPGTGKGNAIPPFEQKALKGWGTRPVSESASQGSGREKFVVSHSSSKERSMDGAPGIVPDFLSGRLEIAAQVGSDVPLFLVGGTVLGQDRGQDVSPLPDLEPVWCVVAAPEIGVSTPQAFRDWDALCAAEGLTPEASTDKLNKLSRAYASAFAGGIPQEVRAAGSSGVFSVGEDLAGPEKSALVRTGITSWIENDFERVVFRQHPSLAEIKRLLAATGTPEAALYASLSGSGSALYGLYLTHGDAEAACARLQAAGVKSFLTRTLPRAAYWRNMLSH